jgi:hypothetical protein
MRFALLALAVSTLPLHGVYTYYRTDPFSSINGSLWQTNQSIVGSSGGLVATGATGGSVISLEAVPGPVPTSYEIRGKLNLAASGGSYVLYLRATSNAWLNPAPGGFSTGTFLGFELNNPQFTSTGCSATLNAVKSYSGFLFLLSSTTVPCQANMELRAVGLANNGINLFVNGRWVASINDNDVTTGKAGAGGYGMPSGNSITEVSLGQLDQTAPLGIDPLTIATAVFDTKVEAQWPGVSDGATGSGI